MIRGKVIVLASLAQFCLSYKCNYHQMDGSQACIPTLTSYAATVSCLIAQVSIMVGGIPTSDSDCFAIAETNTALLEHVDFQVRHELQ